MKQYPGCCSSESVSCSRPPPAPPVHPEHSQDQKEQCGAHVKQNTGKGQLAHQERLIAHVQAEKA